MPAWVRNPIDAFVLARLEREGLTPSPEADRETLIRRVTLDLTGLPPTPAEVDAFLHDNSPNAYEKVVDRLLASPRYGERMAIRWLDAARYADTNGYQTDGERFMWRWRDWVIEAFNHNMPFDDSRRADRRRHAAERDARPEDRHRLQPQPPRQWRGRHHPREYAVEYVVDRVDTTATVLLGLTSAAPAATTTNTIRSRRRSSTSSSPTSTTFPRRASVEVRQLAAVDSRPRQPTSSGTEGARNQTRRGGSGLDKLKPETEPRRRNGRNRRPTRRR